MIGVYILIDDHDRVLYVGASRDVARRVGEHRAKPWWPDVRDVETYAHETWEAALDTERIAIAVLGARHNDVHSDPMNQALEGLRSSVVSLFGEVAP